MSRYSYTEEEKKRNVVLAHQEKECQELNAVFDSSRLDESIESSELLLSELGIPLPASKSSGLLKEKYSYKQLKWVLLKKPEARSKYVNGIIDDELYRTIEQNDLLFEEYTKGCYIVFD